MTIIIIKLKNSIGEFNIKLDRGKGKMSELEDKANK